MPTSVSTGARERPFLRSSVVRSFPPHRASNDHNHRSNQIKSINQNAYRSDRSSPAYLSLVLDRVNAFRRPSRRVTARAEIIVVDVVVVIVASH
jgi:hypothetical protein